MTDGRKGVSGNQLGEVGLGAPAERGTCETHVHSARASLGEVSRVSHTWIESLVKRVGRPAGSWRAEERVGIGRGRKRREGGETGEGGLVEFQVVE